MKKIIITGASSGIGYALAKRLIQKGHKVHNISRTACKLDDVINHSCDIAAKSRLQATLDNIISIEKNIDIGIYSAGYSAAMPVELMDESKARHMWEVNYFGAAVFCKKLAPSMRGQGHGRIVLVGSRAAELPLPYMGYYCATKTALSALAHAVAQELESFGIKCTLAMPGGTATPFTYNRETVAADMLPYCDKYNNSIAHLAQTEQNGMTADDVARAIISTLAKSSPPLLLPIGITNKLAAAAAKILPEQLLGMMTESIFCQSQK